MKEKLHFPDHRSGSGTFPKFILIVILFTTIFSFFGFGFVALDDIEFDPIFLFIFLPVFIAFSIIPILLIYRFVSTSKKTTIDPATQTIEFWEGKKQTSAIRFSELQSFLQSRYTYTVKTKNGSRTVTVYTVTSPEAPNIVFAESTNPILARNFAETFAKTLRVPLTNEQGNKRDTHELDLPFYKRPNPEFDAFSVPEFKQESCLVWEERDGSYYLTSTYNPAFFKWLGTSISIVSFIVLNLVFGSILELNVFYWESFPPDFWQLAFLGGTFLIATFPITYVYFKGMRKKEIILSKDKIISPSGSIEYDKIEEIYQENGDIVCIGDHVHLRISLFFFCDNENYESVKKALIYGITMHTQGKGGTGSARFTTEF
ncbi:hypothetical protein LPTSP3_g16270 [Leptospira kobayashii]|uniref:DUF3592 domain-containing protein n=1 Tax=Leptospira kobayashii TaxID=1917830 RepID=A0ABM7UIV9_9LEPT|nr:hypothetical protein [Leptospira kobayashii]BDA78697.1 hypothetical protein LPTSP3_g16270 [Leptospira kobayashii]